MSLLMDALKRAERARQAEAERSKAEGDDEEHPASSEMSLDPMDDEDITSAVSPQAPVVAPPGTDTEDSLELTPPEVQREIDAMEDSVFGDTGAGDPVAVSAVADNPPREGTAMPLSLEYGDIPLDETGATLPSMRAAQRSVQDYFDGTHSMSLSMDDMQQALSVERGGEGESESVSDPEAGVRTSTMDGDTTSRRQAQAILDARAIAPSTTGRNVALMLLVLLLLGGIGGGAFMFKDRLLALIDGKSAIVVNRPPAGSVTAPPTAVAATQAEQPRVLPADEREALLRAAEVAREEERRLAEEAAAELARADKAKAEQAETAQAEAARAQAEAEQAKAAQSQAAKAPVFQADASPPTLAAVEPGRRSTATDSSMPPQYRERAGQSDAASPTERVELAQVMRQISAGSAGVSLSGLKISKRRRQSRTHTSLVRAYDAFQRGDDGAAMTAYQGVLAREPRNRDAMLGAAAVMMRGGSLDAAASYYAQLLRINPRDGAAQAALIALQDDLDPASGESHVKGLLARAPDDANLHFALGNLYAEQGRWPEAQQSYFEAYRLDQANPDFAFNLAVSLDRLVQGKAAATYYRRAMDLSQKRPAGFESATAARRLAALGGS